MKITPDHHSIPWVRGPMPDTHSEDWHQEAAVTRLRALGWVVAAVPNAGVRRGPTGARMVATGLMAGFPDLVCIRGGCVLFIEMKAYGGRLTPSQKITIPALLRAGAEVYVCEGYEAALWICGSGRPRP